MKKLLVLYCLLATTSCYHNTPTLLSNGNSGRLITCPVAGIGPICDTYIGKHMLCSYGWDVLSEETKDYPIVTAFDTNLKKNVMLVVCRNNPNNQ